MAELEQSAEEAKQPLKQDAMDASKVKFWLNRAKTVNKFHRSQIWEKYKTAKRRYNSENYGYKRKPGAYTNETFNFYFKSVEDFNASIYYKNPTIDLISRNTQDQEVIRKVESLEQLVNDAIKDDASLKAMIRAGLVDENLSSLGVFYIDYDYRTKDTEELIDPAIPDQFKQEEISNRVKPAKLLPENLIRPPFQTLYNYQESPYLGYVDIVSLECLKNDATLDQSVVALLKGKEYKDLLDVDSQELKNEKIEANDGIMFEKIYVIFIKGDDNKPLKRLVLADDSSIATPLAYEDWDKGHGADGRGFPIHVLALNDPCEGFVPPSEAWKLESTMCLIDYLIQKMARHLKKSKTRTLVQGGKDGIKKENITKWLANEDMEIISLHNLPPGMPLSSLVEQIVDQPLSADHNIMFELAKRVFDELSRKPSFAQVAVQEEKKTATETNAIQQQDASQGAYKLDKFRDFLQGFFFDWAKLTQKNMQGYKQITVKSDETGVEEPRELSLPDDLQGAEFGIDINLQSFVIPNKEVRRRLIKETIVDLQAMAPMLKEDGKKINSERCVSELMQTIELRDPDGFVVNINLRDIDRQFLDLVTKGIPMSVDDLGGNPQDALNRVLEIFADEQLVAGFTQQVPNLGMPDSPLAQMARDIEALITKKPPSQPSAPQANTDVGAGASEMAGVA